MTAKTRKKIHPLLLVLDIVIVLLTLMLAFMIVIMIAMKQEDMTNWRLNPSNYTRDLQNGNYGELYRCFYTGYQPVTGEQLTEELKPYAAVAGYFIDSLYLQTYETMGDSVRTERTREEMETYRRDMDIYVPEADKIDKIFDSTR